MERVGEYARLKHTGIGVDVRGLTCLESSCSEGDLRQRGRITCAEHVAMNRTTVEHRGGFASHVTQATATIEVLIDGTTCQG